MSSVPCDIWNISKNAINDFAEDMIEHEAIYGTFLNPLNNKDELYDSSIVKAIHDNQNIALWFSRLPFMQNATINDDIFKNVKKQIGLYWYSKEAILKFDGSPMTACEKAEMNESLRILENGDKMYCHTSKTIIESINIEDDLLKLKNNWKCSIEYKSIQGNNL